MWDNSVWGLIGLSVTFGLAMLLLSPEQEWLRPWLQVATIACGVSSIVVLCWPLRKQKNRTKAKEALNHPRKWASQNVEPRHLIVVGLTGVIIFAALALVGVIWQMRANAHVEAINRPAATPSATAKPVNQAANPQHKPIYRVDEIEEMLGALRNMRKIVDENTAPHAYKTQEIYQQWPHLLMNEGPLAIAGRLEAIRDPIRAAGIAMNELMYKESHYDAELRPVLGDFQNAYGWFDSATSMLIDALKKYASADKALLSDLLKDRYQEWAGGINENVFQRIGKIDANITAKTKELREWPNLGERPKDSSYTKKTVRELRALYEGRTRLQADRFMADEKGKLIEVDGVVVNIDSGMAFLEVAQKGDYVECRFGPEWDAKLGTYSQGQRMKIRGTIGPDQNGAQIYVQNCEIVQ